MSIFGHRPFIPFIWPTLLSKSAAAPVVVNTTPLNITIACVAPLLQHQINCSPLTITITCVAPNVGQSVIVNATPLNLTLSCIAPLIQHEINVVPKVITVSCVAPNLQHQINVSPVSTVISIVSPNILHQVNVGVINCTVTIVAPNIQHQVNTSPVNLVIIIVSPEVSGAIVIELPTGEIYTPEVIQPKLNLFAAFKEHLKFVAPIVSEYLLEDTPLPYTSLGQVFNVLSWKDSCLNRFEESNFRISVYAEDYDELEPLIVALENSLIYNTLLLNTSVNGKRVIFLEQVRKEVEELIPQLVRGQLTQEVIVQREIDQTYISSPTSGETINKCIYTRFKALPLVGKVNDLVSPGYALENTNYPYLVVPKINEQRVGKNSLGRYDQIRYPITCYSEDLDELVDEIIPEIEKSFDYAKFILSGTNKKHMINEWVGTEIHEIIPQVWCGKVNYELQVETPISNYKN